MEYCIRIQYPDSHERRSFCKFVNPSLITGNFFRKDQIPCRRSHSTTLQSRMLYMALLADRGIDYWFANAGTDFAPVVETLAKAQVLETKVPKAVTCPHENTAMHMAIGYFLVTGRPQAVMVHVNVGTANGMNGLLNAARGHVDEFSTLS
jgi:Thiamine pyrophosphate enzyme, N-terminal TPP binding domain